MVGFYSSPPSPTNRYIHKRVAVTQWGGFTETTQISKLPASDLQWLESVWSSLPYARGPGIETASDLPGEHAGIQRWETHRLWETPQEKKICFQSVKGALGCGIRGNRVHMNSEDLHKTS